MNKYMHRYILFRNTEVNKKKKKTYKAMPLRQDEAEVEKGMILFCCILFPCKARKNIN